MMDTIRSITVGLLLESLGFSVVLYWLLKWTFDLVDMVRPAKAVTYRCPCGGRIEVSCHCKHQGGSNATTGVCEPVGVEGDAPQEEEEAAEGEPQGGCVDQSQEVWSECRAHGWVHTPDS
jgi:hypothetical protein